MTAADASFLSSARTWAIESPALKTTLNTAGLEGAANGARSAIACAESTSALGADSVGGYVVSRQPVPCAARREDNTATRMTVTIEFTAADRCCPYDTRRVRGCRRAAQARTCFARAGARSPGRTRRIRT